MDRLSYCLMFILISFFLSGCNPAGVSSGYSQQEGGNESRIVDPRDPEKVTVSNGQGQAEKRIEASGLPGENIENAPFAEERFAYRPTRPGGMPTLQNPKGIPYAEETPPLTRR